MKNATTTYKNKIELIIRKIFNLGSFIFLFAGCSSLAQEYANNAAELGFIRIVLQGSSFEHVIFLKSKLDSKVLHIYLDGDGSPWIAGRPSDDPTPHNPLILNLMAMDSASSVYLGRPCYHEATALGGCSSRYWLQDRYSEDVILSLTAVVKQVLKQGNYDKIAWFGHSGGGTLAVLLANRFPETISVVTIAAILDTNAWSSYVHTDLSGSLNPAELPPLSKQIQQRHYAGVNDQIVPPKLMTKAAAHFGTDLILVDGYDHICCWERKWKSILHKLAN